MFNFPTGGHALDKYKSAPVSYMSVCNQLLLLLVFAMANRLAT